MNNYFILFANCVAVKGSKRSSICDLQNNRIKIVPNLLLDVISLFKTMPVSEIKYHYNNELDEGIDNYLETLEKENFGFWTTEPESFPDLSLQWDSPSIITNAIVDIDEASNYDLENVFSQLNDLGCISLQIRIYWKVNSSNLNELLSFTWTSRIKSIELILLDDGWDIEKIEVLCSLHKRIRSVIVYASSINEVRYLEKIDVQVTFVIEMAHPETHCGAVSPDFFSINIGHFTESQKFNSCLNRKISVDRFGNIKNCPSSKESFGKIGECTFSEVLQNTSFSKYWSISKDQILICKDCEFRYACTDCRVYLTDSNDIYSKPLKCKYNPYTGTWV